MSNTNEPLNQRLGVSAATISRVRSGDRVGSPEFILRVSEVTGVDAGDCLRAAVAARSGGDKRAWIEIVESAIPVVVDPSEQPQS